MAEHHRHHHHHHQHDHHDHHHLQNHPMHTTTTTSQQQNKHSPSKLLAVLTLFPIGGVCFILSGLILTGTLIGLIVATPLFFVFSPVIVPAMLVIAGAVTGFLTAGGFGITGFSSMSYIINYFRRRSGGGGSVVNDQLDYAKRRADDAAGYVGLKVIDVGHRAHEAVRD